MTDTDLAHQLEDLFREAGSAHHRKNRPLRRLVLIGPRIMPGFFVSDMGSFLLQLDAHPDLYDEYEGNRTSHACPFARIMEENLAGRLVQVGIRTMNAHQNREGV